MAFYQKLGAIDVRFDSPTNVPENRAFVSAGGKILGVNIYRSDSEFGKFFKITPEPIGTLTYRDTTRIVHIVEEDVTERFLSEGTDPKRTMSFRVRNVPMVKRRSQVVVANSAEDLEIRVTDLDLQKTETLQPELVRGDLGLVKIAKDGFFDVLQNKLIRPELLDFAKNIRVTCTYFHADPTRIVSNKLYSRIFYKITTAGQDKDGNPLESDLAAARAITYLQTEELDFIWQRAIELNNFMLEQGGERVKLFTRKFFGKPCHNYDTLRKQFNADCAICLGTGFQGGYEGPFDVIIAPPSAEKTLSFAEMGLHVAYQFETWTSPTPLIGMYDVIVRPDGTRYVVNNVNHISVRGMIAQQMFSVSYLDEKDIRYQIPLNPATDLEGPVPVASTGRSLLGVTADSPVITDTGASDERENRGKTPTWENIMIPGREGPPGGPGEPRSPSPPRPPC